jgi:serine/threonine protein kinase
MRTYRGNIYLSDAKEKNFLQHAKTDYRIESISGKFKKSRGGNSSVFKIVSQANDELALKVSKYDLSSIASVAENSNRIERFNREIDALKLSKSKPCANVVEYYFDGELEIGRGRFAFYAMEKADTDLTTYLESNDLSVQQRFLLCTGILKGIQELHDLGIYHRDIKPDNILFVGREWKIGDLGLADFQDPDFDIDEAGERIGPRDWLSPEAYNKCLTENRTAKLPYRYDCKIEAKSDVYQMGKLFWFIFQGNLPEGQLLRKDFQIDDGVLYDVIYNMLRHSKEKRYSLKDIEEGFKTRYTHYGL